MALSFIRKAANAGMNQIEKLTATTYPITVCNDSAGPVRILLEEDPEGVAQLEEWKMDDGIPTVGKAGQRHTRRVQELKKSILATSKPYQEFTLIREQTKTVSMRSPVIKCSVALAEWNGSMKIVEVQHRITEGKTFTIHRGYDRSPGMATLRTDQLADALQAMGVPLGFEEPESPRDAKGGGFELEATRDRRNSAASTHSSLREPVPPPPRPENAKLAPRPRPPAPQAAPVAQAEKEPMKVQELEKRPSHKGPGEAALPRLSLTQEGTEVSRSPGAGFLAMSGQVQLFHCQQWVAAKFVARHARGPRSREMEGAVPRIISDGDAGVFTSREFKCCGAVGGLSSLGKKGPCVAETEIGEGNTCQWVVGSLDRNTSIGFYFDIANQQANSVPQGKQAFLQFQTCYLHPSGRKRLRVTTVSHRFTDAQMSDIQQGFDQEAAAVLMARYAVFKCENEDPLDVLRWVDRMLIRLVSKFADYRKAGGLRASFL
ncbi:unnamed protein product [Effrenium voratum]|nr:unnamed protein product [Effrenium voratum]